MTQDFTITNSKTSIKELKKIIKQNKKLLKDLENIKKKTYNNFIVPYQLISEKLSQFYTPILHLNSVKNSKITQKTYSKCLPILSIYESELLQNIKTYKIIKNIKINEEKSLNTEQSKVLKNLIRDFELNGCNLNKKNKCKLKKINLKISKYSKKFSQNLLDSTNNWEMIIKNKNDLKNIPKSDLKSAEFIDKKDNITKYKFTLHMPSYLSYITYGDSRKNREKIYKAYCTRSPHNEKLIVNILKLRYKKAKLLGYSNYCEYSIASKMANNTNEVLEFLNNLSSFCKNKAIQELKDIEILAKQDGIKKIQSYDVAFYSEKLKKQNYSIDQEYYRAFFEKNSVVNGLFKVLKKLFDINFIENKKSPVWDNKVMVYDIVNNNNSILSTLYLDLETRNDKKDGAWMNDWHSHYKIKDHKQKATAFVVCNFPESTKTTPSLLRHNDVVTLFHEMGHALHHLLSKVNEPFVSGVNGVSWDTVEFPSQFLEYFAYEKKVLRIFAKHYKTKKILGNKAIKRLVKSKNFQSSLAMARQLEFALFDFKLHLKKIKSSLEVQKLLDNIRKNIAPLVPPSYNKFQNGFSHIFAGGYSAGYYSYKWAEVLSADAFYMFINSQIFNKELSLKFKDIIYAKGGSIDMNNLYKSFTNKEPNIKSLLRIDGII